MEEEVLTVQEENLMKNQMEQCEKINEFVEYHGNFIRDRYSKSEFDDFNQVDKKNLTFGDRTDNYQFDFDSNAIIFNISRNDNIRLEVYYKGSPDKNQEECANQIGLEYQERVYEEVIPKISFYTPNFTPNLGVFHLNTGPMFNFFQNQLEQLKSKEEHHKIYKICDTKTISMLALKRVDKNNIIFANQNHAEKLVTQMILTLAIMHMYDFKHNSIDKENSVLIEHLVDPTDLRYYFGNDLFFTIKNVNYKLYLQNFVKSSVGSLGKNEYLMHYIKDSENWVLQSGSKKYENLFFDLKFFIDTLTKRNFSANFQSQEYKNLIDTITEEIKKEFNPEFFKTLFKNPLISQHISQ
jgi:hypothetical protein